MNRSHWVGKLRDGFHRYAGMIILAQVMVWSLGGLVIFFIDFSDLYVFKDPQPVALNQAKLSPATIEQRIKQQYPKAIISSLTVRNVAGQIFYTAQLIPTTRQVLLNAQGQILPALPEKLIRIMAEENYKGDGLFKRADLLSRSSGNYVSSTPIYRATFTDEQKTEMYFDPKTGQILAKRRWPWAIYNKIWEWHLMKYTGDSQTNKGLLLGFALLTMAVSLTGGLKFFFRREG